MGAEAFTEDAQAARDKVEEAFAKQGNVKICFL